MTTYVITIPGTFLAPLTEPARAAVRRELRPADPQQTSLGRREDLDILTVNDDSTFTVRLEVEAADSRSAEDLARSATVSALEQAGLNGDQAPLGPAAVTGIET